MIVVFKWQEYIKSEEISESLAEKTTKVKLKGFNSNVDTLIGQYNSVLLVTLVVIK